MKTRLLAAKQRGRQAVRPVIRTAMRQHAVTQGPRSRSAFGVRQSAIESNGEPSGGVPSIEATKYS